MLKFIEIDGKLYAWKEIVRLRREQTAAARQKQQPALFEIESKYRSLRSRSSAALNDPEPRLWTRAVQGTPRLLLSMRLVSAHQPIKGVADFEIEMLSPTILRAMTTF
jgi:hypothetical protein